MAPKKVIRKRKLSKTEKISTDEEESDVESVVAVPPPKLVLTVPVDTKDKHEYEVKKLWNTIVNLDQLPEVSQENADNNPEMFALYLQLSSILAEFQEKIENGSFQQSSSIVVWV